MHIYVPVSASGEGGLISMGNTRGHARVMLDMQTAQVETVFPLGRALTLVLIGRTYVS